MKMAFVRLAKGAHFGLIRDTVIPCLACGSKLDWPFQVWWIKNEMAKKGVSFPLTMLSIPPKKGAAVRLLNCRVKNALNQPNIENTRINRYFCRAGTPFSLS